MASRMKKGPLQSRKTSPLRIFLRQGVATAQDDGLSRIAKPEDIEDGEDAVLVFAGCQQKARKQRRTGIELSPNGKMEDIVIRHHLLRICLRGLLIEQNGVAWLPDPLQLLLGIVEIQGFVFQVGISEGKDSETRMLLFRNDLLQQSGRREVKYGKTLGKDLSPVIHRRKGKIVEAVIGDESDPLPGNERDDRFEQQIIYPAGEALRFFSVPGGNGFEIGKDKTSELQPGEIDFHALDDILVNGPYIKAGIGHEI